MRRFTLTLLSLLLIAGFELFGASLPNKGGYYRIRNFAANTFIGGTGTGNGSVIHQLPSVDSVYQIFKVTYNSANGYYSFQQKQTGLYITHDNSWNGSFAAKVATTRQSWYIDNVTSADYCSINRVKDDNSHSAGIGYDDATPGASLYMDKTSTKQNKWIFEPILSLDLADLQALVDQANALNSTALASQISAASAFLTSTSEVDVLAATATLQIAIDNYKIAALLESANTATQESPVDVTGLLVNPSFEDGLTGWTNTGFALQGNSWPKKIGTYFTEKWITSSSTTVQSVANSSIAQTLKMSVPNGKYKLIAVAQGLQQAYTPPLATSPTGVSLFGNLASIEVGDSAQYTLENIIVVDKTLTIGLKVVSATANWVAADHFQLFYQGVDLNALANTLSGLISTGGAISGVIQTAASEELAAAIAEGNTVLNNKTEAALNASIARMNLAIVAANASKAAYAEFNTSLLTANTTVATYDDPQIVKTGINAKIAEAQGLYDAHLLDVNGTMAAKDSLLKAVLNFQMDNASQTSPVVLTSMLVNPGFSANTGTGWTGANGAANFSEYELYNKSTIDFYQTITGLRKGQYKVTVQGYHRPGDHSDAKVTAHADGSEVIPVALYANTKTSPLLSIYSDKSCTATTGSWASGDGTLYANNMEVVSTMFAEGKYSANSVIGYVGDDGVLKIGIKTIGTPAANSWSIFDNFQLSFVGLPELESYLIDLEAIAIAAKEFMNGINKTTQVSSIGQKEIGKYNYSDWTKLDSLITVVEGVVNSYVEQTYTGTVSDVLKIQTALVSARAAFVIYLPMNELPNGEYYIKVADMFYLNNPGDGVLLDGATTGVSNSGLVMELNVKTGAQIVTVAKISGVDRTTVIDRYSMFSLLDGRNITERCVFQKTWGTWDGGSDDEWRTHNIYFNGTAYAVQAAGSSSNRGYWAYMTNDQTVAASNIVTVSDTNYVFKFIPVKTIYAEEVAKGRTLFNSAVVGSGPSQYAPLVYSGFKTALETAEANVTAGTATSTNLFAYETALGAFLMNGEVAVDRVTNVAPSVLGGKRMIVVKSESTQRVSIYSLTGVVVSSQVSAGVHEISVDPGYYLVRINNRVTKVVVQ